METDDSVDTYQNESPGKDKEASDGVELKKVARVPETRNHMPSSDVRFRVGANSVKGKTREQRAVSSEQETPIQHEESGKSKIGESCRKGKFI
jgi:hypothetical protein